MTIVLFIIAAVLIGAILGTIFAYCISYEHEEILDLTDVMHDIDPTGTPFLSEIERHRQAHLEARRRENGTGTGIRRDRP